MTESLDFDEFFRKEVKRQLPIKNINPALLQMEEESNPHFMEKKKGELTEDKKEMLALRYDLEKMARKVD